MSTTNRTFLTLAVVAMASLAFTVTPARAAFVATDLNPGGLDTGFAVPANWMGSSNIYPISAPDLTYANYSVTQTGSPPTVYTGNRNNNERMDSRNLAAAMSGDIWFSVLVSVPTGAVNAGLAFDEDAANGVAANMYRPDYSDLRVQLTTTQLVVDMNGGGLPAGTGSYAAGTTHLILGNMIVGAGNDTLRVWIDPNVNAALPTADFTSTTVDFMDAVRNIGVPSNNVTGSSSKIDAIRMSNNTDGTAFEDVTGVPEPATLALMALGGLGLILRRKRR